MSVSHQRQQINKKHILIEYPLLSAAGILFVLSFLGRLYFSSTIISKNIQLKDLFAEKMNLQQEVTRLAYDDSQLSSLSDIEKRAKTMGFVPMSGMISYIDLTVSQPLALKQ